MKIITVFLQPGKLFLSGSLSGLLLFLLPFTLPGQTGAVPVTTLTQPEFTYPFWSPDGEWIVYQSNVTGNNEIYLMRRDGTGRKQLTKNESEDITPAFSPDGTKIAFVSDRDGDEDIYIMTTEGEITDKITRNNQRDIHPYWSPDGHKIIYNTGPDVEKFEIAVADLRENGRVTFLTSNNRFDSYASYSPDGSKIAYISWFTNADGSDNGEIILADSTGKFIRQLTSNKVFDGWPTWGHDGSYLLFSTADRERKTYDLNRVDIRTGEITPVTRDQGWDARANVSRDGKEIVFNRETDRVIRILIIPHESTQ